MSNGECDDAALYNASGQLISYRNDNQNRAFAIAVFTRLLYVPWVQQLDSPTLGFVIPTQE